METRNNINPRPFQPVSPGCILKEELEARSLPISDFAHKIGLEEFELDKLLNGTLCLSPEIASSLERFLGIPASFWLSLQSAYEEDLDKSDNKCFFICSFHLNCPTTEEQITDRQVWLLHLLHLIYSAAQEK